MALLFAKDALSDVPRQDTNRILTKIDWLWLNREYVNHTPLSENLYGYFKHRLGKYRIIYKYDIDIDEMIIFLVGTRDTIYKDADKKLRS